MVSVQSVERQVRLLEQAEQLVEAVKEPEVDRRVAASWALAGLATKAAWAGELP